MLLLTGDIEVEAQRAMVQAGIELRADILKIPHHGSRYQDPEFLRAVGASVAVVSVGEGNDYGHPSMLLLSELARDGAHTLRTDLDGDVAVCEQDGRLAVVRRWHPRVAARGVLQDRRDGADWLATGEVGLDREPCPPRQARRTRQGSVRGRP